MPQFARPNADITDGNWLNDAGSAVDLFASIDEVTPSDTDFIESGLAPSSDAVAMHLSDPEDPQSSTGHIIRWRRGKNTSGGAQIDLTTQLRQGYVSEASQGTLITSQSDANIPDAFTTTSYTLSGAEADSITNYADLQLRIVANQV